MCPIGVSRQRQNFRNRWNVAACMLLSMLLCCAMMLWITPVGSAEDNTGTGITATENITDTENLLGSNVAEITDAISATKQETGVTVHLLYLASFNTEEKPAKWASALLESLDPKPNTVLLAVASNDGNLVVAVSSNSDEWLKKKSTVDALSDAAQKPLMESTPDWSKSATDMMDQIAVQKKTSTSSQTVLLGVGRHDSRAGAADCDYGGVPYSAQAWHHQAQGAQACGKACRDYCAFRAGEGVECRW